MPAKVDCIQLQLAQLNEHTLLWSRFLSRFTSRRTRSLSKVKTELGATSDILRTGPLDRAICSVWPGGGGGGVDLSGKIQMAAIWAQYNIPPLCNAISRKGLQRVPHASKRAKTLPSKGLK